MRFFALFFFFFLIVRIDLSAQAPNADQINILFYNTENLFDTHNDPETLDDEFTPSGARHWTVDRFRKKVNHLSKVILVSSGFNPPDIVGLCEIENRQVLEKLLNETPLRKYGYSIIHKNSPDERGIDVALLFRNDHLQPVTYEYLPILDEDKQVLSTREILHAVFVVGHSDTLHVLFNHWPSRYRGQAETNALRLLAAHVLRNKVDAIFDGNPSSKICIMGDFNDEPQSKSIVEGLRPVDGKDSEKNGQLVNLSANWEQGTIKFRQTWSVFDQIIVSGGLLLDDGWHTTPEQAKVVELPFLFEEDSKYRGKKLNRTFVGFKYHGGFSDHLPVLLELTP